MTYNQVAAAIDETSHSKQVAARAKQLAQQNDADVCLVHVIEDRYYPSSSELYGYDIIQEYEKKHQQNIRKSLNELASDLAIEHDNIAILNGRIAQEIKTYSENYNIDLLVLGAHKKDGIGSYFGSNANSILHHANTDILMTRTQNDSEGSIVAPYKKILLAIDFIPEIEPVIKQAQTLAQANNATIEMVYVVDGPLGFDIPSDSYKKQLIEKAQWQFKQLKSVYDLGDTKSQVLVGNVSSKISHYADKHDCDVILTGSHGRHGIGLLLGSVTNSLFHKADCDVLAVNITR